MEREGWVDASAGVAGDMLLGALLDAGADLSVVRAAVEAVLPGEVELRSDRVRRSGLAAVHVHVVATGAPPARAWAQLRDLLSAAPLAERVRTDALSVFSLLARVEARAHGVPEDEVHFHEVGAWDSVADVVGVCAALADLGVGRMTCGPVGLGSGTVRTEHGVMPVPVPAVLGVLAETHLEAAEDPGLTGECATPTGVALLAALGEATVPGPSGRVLGAGTGAGTRDVAGRANVTRVVLLEAGGGAARPGGSGAVGGGDEELVELAATVDDLDPRVWPSVVQELLTAGALDAWLTPVQMKKGRPGTVVSVLAGADDRDLMVDVLLAHTSTLGVRSHAVRRTALERRWVQVAVPWGVVRVKLGTRRGRILSATPELEDCRAVAEAHGVPLRVVLRAAEARSQEAGWSPGGEDGPSGAAI